MSVLEFIVALVKAVAWPAVTLALLISQRAQIGALLGRLRTFRGPGGFEFDTSALEDAVGLVADSMDHDGGIASSPNDIAVDGNMSGDRRNGGNPRPQVYETRGSATHARVAIAEDKVVHNQKAIQTLVDLAAQWGYAAAVAGATKPPQATVVWGTANAPTIVSR